MISPLSIPCVTLEVDRRDAEVRVPELALGYVEPLWTILSSGWHAPPGPKRRCSLDKPASPLAASSSRLIRTRTGRHENADTDASSDGKRHSAAASQTTCTPAQPPACRRPAADTRSLTHPSCHSLTRPKPSSSLKKKATKRRWADLHADRIQPRPRATPVAKPIRGCVLEPKRPRLPPVCGEV
jgi:hypothetical protein